MRAISLIVVHCSATREDKSFTEHDLDVCHRRRGFNGVGYHFYIRKNGDIKSTRPLERIGAHARGFNSDSIGICYEGGLDTVAETFFACAYPDVIEGLSRMSCLRTS